MERENGKGKEGGCSRLIEYSDEVVKGKKRLGVSYVSFYITGGHNK
jgi:hypothetical protein